MTLISKNIPPNANSARPQQPAAGHPAGTRCQTRTFENSSNLQAKSRFVCTGRQLSLWHLCRPISREKFYPRAIQRAQRGLSQLAFLGLLFFTFQCIQKQSRVEEGHAQKRARAAERADAAGHAELALQILAASRAGILFSQGSLLRVISYNYNLL